MNIQVQDLHFTYPNGVEAIQNINLSIESGAKVAIVGMNGAGKTTLVRHFNGLLKPTNGHVMIGDWDTHDYPVAQLASRVGYVFQNPDDQLFSPTVFEDVAFGPLHMGFSEDETKTRVADALNAVGMEKFADRLSYHLSTGEKKRVAIATVLSMEPDLIILDEPSAGLDPRARRSLINLLRDLPQSLLVATHDLLMVRELLPRTVILDSGKVVADGPTEQLLADEELLEAHGLELPV